MAERPEFLRGRVAEEFVAGLLRSRGWYVIPSALYAGPDGNGAPLARDSDSAIVLPDLDVARHGTRRWAEVKAKAAPTFTRKTFTYDHGIGLRKWIHYRRIERETGAHVWLFIIEECRQVLLFESLDRLGDGRRYTGEEMDPGGMMFWPRTLFQKMLLNALPGFEDAGRARADW
jgi:hypothetical protein